jgi:hypothetical protein
MAAGSRVWVFGRGRLIDVGAVVLVAVSSDGTNVWVTNLDQSITGCPVRRNSRH